MPTGRKTVGLPVPPACFVDREQEKERLFSLLDSYPVIMVKGLPGIGKSAFAAHALGQWSCSNTERTIIWYRCQSGVGLNELLSELSSLCGPEHGEFLTELLQSEFDQTLLVSRFLASLEDVGIITVLDDAYRLSGAELETLIEESCRLLRRSSLVLLGPQVTGLSPLLLSEVAAIRLQGIPWDDAAMLCTRLFEAHGEALPDQEIIHKAVTMTRGHPLFLRWLVGLAFQERTTLRDVLAGHGIGQLGSRLIEPLWEGLSQRERNVMRYLAVLGGSAGRWLLEQVVSGAAQAITRLADRMLIDTEPGEGMVQLSLPVREFIFQRMAEEDTDVFSDCGKKLVAALKSGGDVSKGSYALKAYRLLLASGDREAAVEAAGLMASFLVRKGRYGELSAIPEELGLAPEQLLPALATAVFQALAVIGRRSESLDFFRLLRRDSWPAAYRLNLVLAVLDQAEPAPELSAKLLGEAKELVEELDEPEGRIRYLIAEAVVSWREGDLPKAKKSLGRALGQARRNGYTRLVSEVSQRLGMIMVREGKLTTGLKILRLAGESLRGRGRSNEHAALLGNRGTIHKELGNIEKARDLFQKALAIRESLGDRMGMSTVHNNLGLLLFQLRRLDEAEHHLQVSLDCLEEIHDPMARATTINNKTLVAAVLGQLEQAVILSEEAIDLLGQAGHNQPRGLCYSNLAIYKMMMGDRAGSRKARQQAEAVARSVSNPRLAGSVFQRLGQLYRLEGKLEKAQTMLDHGLSLLQGTEARKETAFVLTELAEMAIERQNGEAALEWIDQAESCFPTCAFPWLSLTWLSLRAEGVLVSGNKQAETLALLLLDEAKNAGLLQFEAKAYLLLREAKPAEYSEYSRQYSSCRLKLNRQERFWVDDIERRMVQRSREGKISWAGAAYRVIEAGDPAPATGADVEKLRENAENYALWLDVEKKVCHEQTRGAVPLFRKRVLAPLLLFFMRNPGARFPAETIFEKVWGVPATSTDRSTLMVNLTRLRQLVEADPENPRYIMTVPGIDGRAEYFFNPDARSCLIEPLD